MVYAILLFISLFPVIFIAGLLYLMDKEKEKFGAMIKYYLLGLLSAVIAVIAEVVLGLIIPSSETNLLLIGIQAFLVIAASEELAKFACLKLGLLFEKSYDNFYDSIIFATAVSLGFAGIENVLYVLSSGQFSVGIGTGLMRAFLAVPGHAIFAIYMGFFLDKAMEAKMKRKGRAGYYMLAIILPILLHGTYDFFCFSLTVVNTPIYLLMFVGYIVFMYISGILLIVKGVKKSHITFNGSTQNDINSNLYRQQYVGNVCCNCGKVINGSFCPYCGTFNQVQQEPSTYKYCPRCGNYSGGTFCNRCGCRL